ncbi:hypothetical protein EVAR_77917_1 [Eumeta japonica]|uniref:Uncharacterized protein n=1 Tax=Eumeta variegata TaxID=151549 RepID=A0A4C1XR11_EUMVA|nr:hypothetical protein EVAR_77917_1 [Eumeta japonica]
METSLCNVQKCVEQLRRHDLVSHGGAARTEGGVLAEPRGLEPPAAPCPVEEIAVSTSNLLYVILNTVQLTARNVGAVCAVRPVTVKVEDDGADAVTCRGPHTDVLIKEEDDAIMKTIDEMEDHMIKQELDIGPVVLQPKTMHRLLSPSILGVTLQVLQQDLAPLFLLFITRLRLGGQGRWRTFLGSTAGRRTSSVGVMVTRTKSNSPRNGISRNRQSCWRSSDLNHERYRDQVPARRCTIGALRGSIFSPQDSYDISLSITATELDRGAGTTSIWGGGRETPLAYGIRAGVDLSKASITSSTTLGWSNLEKTAVILDKLVGYHPTRNLDENFLDAAGLRPAHRLRAAAMAQRPRHRPI